MDCPNEKVLSSYLDEILPAAERAMLEGHIAGCNHCLDVLLVAYEAQCRPRKCQAIVKQKVRKRLGLKDRKVRPGLKWFYGALLLFTLSFVFKRFFLQFLIGAAILGFKWVVEGEGAKRAIMIFRGMRKDETSDFPRTPTNRIKKKNF